MNYLRRRLSDSSFVANLPNGYMMDFQRPSGSSSSTSSPASPATERKQQPAQPAQPAQPQAPPAASGSFLSSFSSVVKTAQIASAVQAKAAAHGEAASAVAPTASPAAPAKPAVRKPKVLLVIDDAHTDWLRGCMTLYDSESSRHFPPTSSAHSRSDYLCFLRPVTLLQWLPQESHTLKQSTVWPSVPDNIHNDKTDVFSAALV
ncbi:hypothetical protein SRHO_G00088380 [Serrasalmus rhombeus]